MGSMAKDGHRIPYKDYIMAPTKLPIQDPCRLASRSGLDREAAQMPQFQKG